MKAKFLICGVLRLRKSNCASLFLLLLISIGFIAEVKAQSKTIHVLKLNDAKSLKAYFKHTGTGRPIISGHRGGITSGFPENSIETFLNTLTYTPAFYEIDPRLTKDSIPVLMHDATLDRTTTGTGKVGDYTLEELQKFRLKDPTGKVTNFKIPTLKAALMWSKGKTIMNLDHKDVPFAMIAKVIKESGNEAVMLTIHSPAQALFYLKDQPDRMFSVHILTKKSFLAYEAAKVPWENMIAYIGPRFTAENKELMELLHAKGVMCMISAAPSFDKLASETARAIAIAKLLCRAPTFWNQIFRLKSLRPSKGSCR
jgi:glycerophosphoryl diester phosphodiesterase